MIRAFPTSYIFLLFFLLGHSAFASPLFQEQEIHQQDRHIIDDDPLEHSGPTTSESIRQKLERAAEDYEKYAPVHRIAFHDIAFPKDKEELSALNGLAVILITTVTHDASELPLRKVHVRMGDDSIELPTIARWATETEVDSKIQRVLGSHREDRYVLIPIAFLFSEGELMIDFAENRIDFSLARFPDPVDLDYLGPDDDISSNPEKDIDVDALRNLILREFPTPLPVE